jgi:hypothetical protein
MKLYVVSVRTKLVAVFSIIAFIMIAVVSSASLTEKRPNKVDNHFKNDELKMQGVTAEQQASKAVVLNAVSIEKPKMPTNKEALYTLVAAVTVVGGEFEINDPNDDSPSSSDNNNNGL